MTIWYIFCSFGTFFPVLVSCTKKNLATLVGPKIVAQHFLPQNFLGNFRVFRKHNFTHFFSPLEALPAFLFIL
jgi:hypothetical protein